MLSRVSVLAIAALFAASPMTAAAAAPDPCRQAVDQEREAEARFWRWCDNHTYNGSCGVYDDTRGEILYNQWQAAVRNREQSCN